MHGHAERELPLDETSRMSYIVTRDGPLLLVVTDFVNSREHECLAIMRHEISFVRTYNNRTE